MTIRTEAEEALASLAVIETAGGIVALPTLDEGVIREETVILEVALVVDHRRAALGLVPALARGSEDPARTRMLLLTATESTTPMMSQHVMS